MYSNNTIQNHTKVEHVLYMPYVITVVCNSLATVIFTLTCLRLSLTPPRLLCTFKYTQFLDIMSAYEFRRVGQKGTESPLLQHLFYTCPNVTGIVKYYRYWYHGTRGSHCNRKLRTVVDCLLVVH